MYSPYNCHDWNRYRCYVFHICLLYWLTEALSIVNSTLYFRQIIRGCFANSRRCVFIGVCISQFPFKNFIQYCCLPKRNFSFAPFFLGQFPIFTQQISMNIEHNTVIDIRQPCFSPHELDDVPFLSRLEVEDDSFILPVNADFTIIYLWFVLRPRSKLFIGHSFLRH